MKRILLLFAVAFLIPSATFAEGKVKHAEWFFAQKKKNFIAEADFLQTSRYYATTGDEAWFRFEGADKCARPTLNRNSELSYSNTREGDCWYFEMPVEELPKGSVIDLWAPFHAYPTGEGHRFVVEYRDGTKWLPLMPTSEDGANYRTAKISRAGHIWHSFRLQKPIKRGVVSVRIRQIEKWCGASYVALLSRSGVHPQMICHPAPELRDTTRILFIGNSATYCNTYPFIFKDIAMREGHYADCRMTFVGGFTMTDHLKYGPTIEAIEAGGYDYAFFQCHSYKRIFNGTEDDMGVLQPMKDIVALTRKHNPEVQPLIALAWARKYGNNHISKRDKPLIEKYPTFFSNFEAMQTRLNEVVANEAKSVGAKAACYGHAWQIVCRERPEIELYAADGAHPSYTGSYLAAAVAYLTIYGEPFGANPSDGRLDAETAAYLRSVAERVVLKGER